MDDAEKNDVERAEEERDVDKKVTHKEKPEFLLSTSSQSLSSNYEIHTVPSAPLLDVRVSVIPEQPIPPTPTPPITSEAPHITTTKPNPLLAVIQRLDDLERKFDAWTKVDHSEAVEASKDMSEIRKIKLEHASKQKWPKHSTTPFDQTTENEYKQKDILFQMMMASNSYEKQPAHKALYDALIQSLFMDEDDMDRGIVEPSTQTKRRHDDQDEDPFAESNQRKTTKRRRTKESDPLKKSSTSKDTSKGNTPPKASKADKSVNAEKIVAKPTKEVTIDVEEKIIDDMDLVGPVYKLLKGTWQSSIELEYNMKECYKALSDQHDWANLEGVKYPYDLSKPLLFKGHPVYNKDVGYGVLHWGPNRQLFYRSQIKRLSRHDVYSTLKILSVVSVTVDKQFGYGYLKEIVVRRADRKLYTFKEGDFINLHLNDIEDMLLLVVQHKLFHLNGDTIIDLAIALRMFTKRIVI
nr:hypothetical protein [Tanacetum cinerariifolium]